MNGPPLRRAAIRRLEAAKIEEQSAPPVKVYRHGLTAREISDLSKQRSRPEPRRRRP